MPYEKGTQQSALGAPRPGAGAAGVEAARGPVGPYASGKRTAPTGFDGTCGIVTQPPSHGHRISRGGKSRRDFSNGRDFLCVNNAGCVRSVTSAAANAAATPFSGAVSASCVLAATTAAVATAAADRHPQGGRGHRPPCRCQPPVLQWRKIH